MGYVAIVAFVIAAWLVVTSVPFLALLVVVGAGGYLGYHSHKRQLTHKRNRFLN